MISKKFLGSLKEVYYEKLDNGLDIYIIPNNKQKRYCACLVVKYGSDINTFKPINSEKYITIPLGVAHFLEHKMFDMEKGNPFDFFGKYATFVNASTSYEFTKYYIEGKKSVYKNLDYLIELVFTPYFVDEQINGEKNIIAEEIKMYEDQIEWQLDLKARDGLFKNIFLGNIAGTVDSIMEIDAHTLQMVYDTFYQPSNMFLVVSGNVNPEKVIEVVKKNTFINNHTTNYPIKIKKEKEKREVILEYQEMNGLTIKPKLRYSYKFDLNDLKIEDQIKTKFYLNLLFTYLFGNGSLFSEKIVEEKIATAFYDEYMSKDNIYMISLFAESDYADMFVDLVDDTLKNIKIEEDDFIRIKKIWYSILIRSIDNPITISNSLIEDIIKNNQEFDNFAYIDSLSYNELLKVIQKLDLSNKSLVLLFPKK